MSHFHYTTRNGEEATLDESSLQPLQERLRGELITSGHPAYDEARKVYNGMHDRRPALVVRTFSVADVMAAVRFASQHDFLLAVRGGGHSAPGFGTCDGGMVIDLGRMRGIRVDPESRTARAEGGCTWGDFNHATHAFGLATTGGVVSTTGIAGLTLGGGMGHLSRRFGLSCDNLVSADVVTSEGGFVTCSAKQEPDLFWAIRGGGGNFGVVTSFEYRLHPVSEVLGGPIFFELDGDVLQRYRDFIGTAPEDFGGLFGFTRAAPLPFLPTEWHGKPVCAVLICWTGSGKRGQEMVSEVSSWGRVIGSHVGPMPYPVINTLFDPLQPPGLQQYWKGNFVRWLSNEAVAAHLQHAPQVPCIESGTFLFPINGACHRVAGQDTAFAFRDVLFSTVVSGAWPDPGANEENKRWVRDYYEALRPHSEEGGYVNFMTTDDEQRVTVNYRQNYDRLARVKALYDPKNLFQLNQNIRPGPSAQARPAGKD